MDDEGTVIELAVDRYRRACHDHRHEIARGFDKACSSLLGGPQHQGLMMQVVQRIAGQRQLGEEHQCGAALISLSGQCNLACGVLGRIARRYVGRISGHTYKSVAVEVVKSRHDAPFARIEYFTGCQRRLSNSKIKGGPGKV